MRLFIIFLISLQLFGSKLYFMPYEAKSALKEFLASIDKAHSNIDILIYSFTHKKIAKHLKNAAKRGVKIRLIADYKQNIKSRYSQIGYLAKYRNIFVYTIKGKPSRNKEYYGKMHIKMAIIDHKKLIFGSANWSYFAFSKNYEILYFLEDRELANKSERYFQKILLKAKPY